MSRKTGALVVAIAFSAMVMVNYLAVTLPLNGIETGAVSALYPNYFTPAGFTFAIWGIIYTALAGFVIYNLSRGFKSSGSPVTGGATPWIIANFILNAAWLFSWHYQLLALSVAIMLALLLSLAVIHSKLSLARPWRPLAGKVFLDLPFSIYFGWISVATIANVAVWHQSAGVVPFGMAPETWAAIMISKAASLAIVMLWVKRNTFFLLVVCWGCYGISSARLQEGTEEAMMVASIARTCIFIMLLAWALYQAWPLIAKRRTRVKPASR